MNKGTKITPSNDCTLETMSARRQWDGILKILPEKRSCQPSILYSEKLSLKHKDEIKSLSDKQKLRYCC